MFGQLAKRFSLPLIRLCIITGCGDGYYSYHQLWQYNNSRNNNNKKNNRTDSISLIDYRQLPRQLNIGTGSHSSNSINNNSSSIGFRRTYLFDEDDLFYEQQKFVRIVIENHDYNTESSGTGFLICGQLASIVYAVTCAHVAQHITSCFIYDHSDNIIAYGQFIYSDPQLDLTLIRFSLFNPFQQTIAISQMADESDIEFGDEIITIGVPTGLHGSYDWFPGIVNNPYSQQPRNTIDQYIQLYNTVDIPMLQTSAEMIAGMSGGPVFSTNTGNLVSYQVSGSPLYRYFYGGQISLVNDFYFNGFNYAYNRFHGRQQEHGLDLGLVYYVEQFNQTMVVIHYTIAVHTYGNYQLMNNYYDWGVIYQINGQYIQTEQDFREILLSSDIENPLSVTMDIGNSGQMSGGFIWFDPQIIDFKIV
ncbi:uncharacterized protein LOC128962817 [Oppia nitens]|uniref:uncharacterized protein LOC128962817 n=1 Tax=Oppia nitens TaxID=1686743 RepID=UPI0023DBAC88|nr:uncharacterized protein LOC128962817 [Oppia nitens]